MLPGWWPVNWWPTNWWPEDWWPDYGIPSDLYNSIIALEIEEYNGMTITEQDYIQQDISASEYITQNITVRDSV